jgi:hypothetical protein
MSGEGGVPDAPGGAPGTGGSSGGFGGLVGDPPSVVELVGSLDGRLIQIPCLDWPNSTDCSANAYVDSTRIHCLNGQLDVGVDHPVAGVSGRRYLVTLHLYGIMETRDYGPDVTREAGNVHPANADEGADPPPFAVGLPGLTFPAHRRPLYEIHVLDDAMQEVGLYLVNAGTAASETDRDTYVIDYERTITVVGGGLVRLRVFESDCRLMKNCGVNAEMPCGLRTRTVDVSSVSPPVPMSKASEGGLAQPALGEPTDHSGQWWLIDVTAVSAM